MRILTLEIANDSSADETIRDDLQRIGVAYWAIVPEEKPSEYRRLVLVGTALAIERYVRECYAFDDDEATQDAFLSTAIELNSTGAEA